MAVRVFVDFDGTVTAHDVGNALFEGLGGPECRRLIAAYHAGTLSARDCFLGEAALAGEFEPRAMDRILDAQELDAHFAPFARYCREQALPLCILSDGLDYYIDRILGRHGLEGIPRLANTLRLVPAPGGRVRMALEFPAGHPECDRCAMCKRNVMLARSGDRDAIVYVGEGYSDRCPAAYADLVFAKEELQRHCQQENISYLPYRTFADVQRQLRGLLEGPGVPKRHRAEARRREAFRAE